MNKELNGRLVELKEAMKSLKKAAAFEGPPCPACGVTMSAGTGDFKGQWHCLSCDASFDPEDLRKAKRMPPGITKAFAELSHLAVQASKTSTVPAASKALGKVVTKVAAIAKAIKHPMDGTLRMAANKWSEY